MSSKKTKSLSPATTTHIKEEKPDAETPPPLPINKEKPSLSMAPSASSNGYKTATEEEEEEEREEEEKEEDEGNPLLKSIGKLRGLSFSLSNFTRRFRDMEDHMKSIQKTILEKSKELDSPQSETPQGKKEENQQQKKEEEKQPPAPAPAPASKPLSGIERICSSMSSKGLKKYVSNHLSSSDVGKLRDEVSAALKLAPDPARLVLDCFGRFYIQGSKAFSKDSSTLAARNLGIHMLEFYILSGCSKIEPLVKDEAERAAVAWRSRIVHEGGIGIANAEDALGLLLLVVAFGILSEFGAGDLCELVRVSNLKKKAEVLRCSPLFLEKFQDIIPGMVNNGLHVSAVDLACTLGLEDKFSPQSLLSSFISETNQTAKKMRREGQGSREKLKEACEKQLAALKSVIKCLKDHKLISVDLSCWKINEKIANIEKEFLNLAQKSNEKAVPKRKAIEFGSSEKDKTQAKRHQPIAMKASPQPPPVMQPQGQHLYDGLLANIMYSGVGLQGSLHGLPGAVQPDGGVGLLWAGNAIGAVAGTSAGPAAGAGPWTPSATGSSIASGMDPYIGYSNRMPIGNGVVPLVNSGIGLNGLHRDAAYENSIGQKGLFGLPSSVGQKRTGPPSTIESFAGLPHRGSGSSNLFSFVDTVLLAESDRNSSHERNTAPATPSIYHPSYY